MGKKNQQESSRNDSFFSGSPILTGSNTVPGTKIPKEIQPLLGTIFKTCKDFGLDFYPTIVQFLRYDEMSEIASYGGFAVRYPHWQFGAEYEKMQRLYEYGYSRIFELVINTNPCVLYCLDSNTMLENINVLVHALGHNHFFKNNIYFYNSNTDMVNVFANNGTSIRKYIKTWGKETVSQFMDNVFSVEPLINPANIYKEKTYKKESFVDEKKHYFKNLIPTRRNHEYMNDWFNTKDYIDKEEKAIKDQQLSDDLNLFQGGCLDIFAFLKENAPLKSWQQDIMDMIYNEQLYFYPQGITKTINEGFASWVDSNIMAKQGLASLGQDNEAGGIIEYAKCKAGVLGGKYSMNPYKLGYELLCHIEDRWNKGRFGEEYEQCEDMRLKENWDTGANLGKEKVFEVAKYYNDYQLINTFFDRDFCEQKEFFIWERQPNGDIIIKDRDYKSIKKKLLQSKINRNLPYIVLDDCNYKSKGILLLRHLWDGRPLLDKYVKGTMKAISAIWQNTVVLSSGSEKDEKVYICDNHVSKNRCEKMSRSQFEKNINELL